MDKIIEYVVKFNHYELVAFILLICILTHFRKSRIAVTAICVICFFAGVLVRTYYDIPQIP